MTSAFRRWMFVTLASLGLLAETVCAQMVYGELSRYCCYVVQKLSCTGCTKMVKGPWAGKYVILGSNAVTRCGNFGATSTLCEEFSQVCSTLRTGRPIYNASCANQTNVITKFTTFSRPYCKLNCVSSGVNP
jgi:hypothetical protein